MVGGPQVIHKCAECVCVREGVGRVGGELYGLVKPPFGSVKKRGQKVERSSRKAPRKPNMYIQLVTYCTVHKFAN